MKKLKKLFSIGIIFCLIMTGCKGTDKNMDGVLKLRQQVQKSDSEFTARITADYLKNVECFTLACQCSKDGAIEFQVKEPECIEGISGNLSNREGNLTFDDKLLVFPMLADGILSPVSMPWVLMEGLRGGYLVSCGKKDEALSLTIYDTYEEEKIQILFLMDQNYVPIYGEVYWKDCRILSAEIENFQFL